MSGAGPLIEVTYRKLAFVKNGDDGNDLVDLNVKDGVVLDAETSKARLQMIDRKSNVRMPSQCFEAFLETAHIKRRRTRSECPAGIGSDI
ncbi:MAG: hypothetical protein VR74_07200 [Hyphomonas sp. BRH_c22]|nr:MAG: hypothetical protein VR74_07200 [Hyphomonas sp. BRH_c22]